MPSDSVFSRLRSSTLRKLASGELSPEQAEQDLADIDRAAKSFAFKSPQRFYEDYIIGDVEWL